VLTYTDYEALPVDGRRYDLLAELAGAAGAALPLTALATQLFRLHDGRGHGELNITSIVKLYETGVG